MSEPPRIGAITLFVGDRDEARRWYALVLTAITASGPATAEPIWQDDASVVFRLGEVMINLLHRDAGDEFIAPDAVGGEGTAIRAVATIDVDDVDAAVARLRDLGVEPALGPVTRSWGPRTANLRDPFGHVWELATPASG